MGISYRAILIYGTDSSKDFERLPEKLKYILSSGYTEEGYLDLRDMFDGEKLEPESIKYLGEELYQDFKEVSFFNNGYYDFGEGFEAFGFEFELENFHSLQLQENAWKISNVFRKYGLNAPRFINFVHVS